MNKIDSGWLPFFNKYSNDLNLILETINYNDKVYPPKDKLFRALFYFSPEEIKLVILGQDPYISSYDGIPQACGLSFSVPECHKLIPPSLKNIFKEIKNCYSDYEIPSNGCLERWASNEKILLLNASLTVNDGKSNSHAVIWSKFTDNLIRFISENNEGTIFLLMGNFAINKEKLISDKHKIFKTVHPSPLSAFRGFFGCKIFLKINEYLIENELEPIKW